MSQARTSTAKKSRAAKAAPAPSSAPRRKGGQTTIPGSTTAQAPRVVSEIPLSEIRPDPRQPGRFFDVSDIVPTLRVREDDFRRLLVELALCRSGYHLKRPAELAGVDHDKIEAQVASELPEA